MVYNIKYFGYDIYELEPNLGPGMLLKTKTVAKRDKFNGFADVESALKYVCSFLGTAYHKNDWCFEEGTNVDGDDDMWVLHIIVDTKNCFATRKMIEDWRKDKIELYDLLVNVKFDVDTND